jgi:hypothetical protein
MPSQPNSGSVVPHTRRQRLLRRLASLAICAALVSPARAQPGETGPSTRATGGEYRVQLGAFRTEAQARALCDPLIERGDDVAVAPERARDGTVFFICRTARSYARSQAKALADQLRSAAQEAIIVRVAPPRAGHAQPAEAKAAAIDPKLRQNFDRFMQERDKQAEREAFEQFLKEHPTLLAPASRGPSEPSAGTSTPDKATPPATNGE